MQPSRLKRLLLSIAAALIPVPASVAQSQLPHPTPATGAQRSDRLAVGNLLTWATADTLQPRSEAYLKLLCAAQVNGQTISFASLDDNKVLLAAFSAGPLADPRKDIWLKPRVRRAEDRPRPTEAKNLAYVYDQNDDGRIDHLAFWIGTLNVEPPNAPADLPPNVGSRIRNVPWSWITQYWEWLARPAFWQAIDQNGDGVVDWLAFPARKKSNGWYRGWMAVPQTAQAGSKCEVRDRDWRLIGECVARSGDSYESASMIARSYTLDPQERMNELLAAARACHLGRGDFRRMP